MIPSRIEVMYVSIAMTCTMDHVSDRSVVVVMIIGVVLIVTGLNDRMPYPVSVEGAINDGLGARTFRNVAQFRIKYLDMTRNLFPIALRPRSLVDEFRDEFIPAVWFAILGSFLSTHRNDPDQSCNLSATV